MTKTILMVDEDSRAMRALADPLEDEGFEVLCETDGDQALRSFESNAVDFVILEVLVHSTNGFTLAERIRASEKGREVPILMVSKAFKSANHRLEAMLKYGVVEFLDKPVDVERLLDLLWETFGSEFPSVAAARVRREQLDLAMRDRAGEVEREEVVWKSHKGADTIRAGSLTEKDFCSLLAELNHERIDGTLRITSEQIEKSVYFKAGYPIFVKSNLPRECLGQMLLRNNAITPEELQESLRKMQATGCQQGATLINMGCISPRSLQIALQQQLKEKLYDLFGWERGRYELESRLEPPPTTVSLGGTAAAIIFDGIKKKYDLARLQRLLAGFMDMYLIPHPNLQLCAQDMGLDSEEEALVALLDETRQGDQKTLREFVQLGTSREQILQVIYALKCASLVSFAFKAGDRMTTDFDLDIEVEMETRGSLSRSTLPPFPNESGR